MESEAQVIRHSPESLPMACSRGFSLYCVKALCIIWCILFHHAVSGPCLVSGTQGTVEEKDKCELRMSDCVPVVPNTIPSSGNPQANSEPPATTLRNVGSSSGMFFFPSTLQGSSLLSGTNLGDSPGKLSDPSEMGCHRHGALGLGNLSWSSDYGMSNLMNGRAVSCSLNSIQDTNGLSYRQSASTNQNAISSCRGPLFDHKVASSEAIKNSNAILSSSSDGSVSPRIEIDPPVLDYGEKHLYMPSLAYLTVLNTWNDSILHVYQPFSTDSQFFPCNFSEATLGPGEAASLCFIFLPKSLGLSSGHLILQTNFGGFLVQVKGFAAEFPYGQALAGSEVSSVGRWRKNLSLFNPFDETIYVEEIAMWVSVSLGNTSLHMDATCSACEYDPWDPSNCRLLSIKDWFLVKGEHVDLSLMAMRPHSNWKISPRSGETVAEIDMSFGSVGRIFGAFCIQLKRASQDEAEIVMLPVEAEIDRMIDSDGSTGILTVSLERVSQCDTDEGVVTVSLRNTGSHVISVDKISEVAESELLQINYIEGLLLFPKTTTKVALVSCAHTAEVSDLSRNCKVLVQTNDSRSPIGINCDDIVYLCSRQRDSSVGTGNPTSYGGVSGSMRTGSLTRGKDLPHAKALERTDLDKVVLQNWKSQGTNAEVSVLEDHELLYSVVQIGDHLSKWITVRNPSPWPVVMQLVLNSVEIMDKCQEPVDDLRPVASPGLVQSESTSPRRYGFSLADWARTEAFVHPHSTASLGPIIFHPSSRCEWRSSALMRNNLSGVEWVSLRGSGGSYSLAIIENFKPVRTLDFRLEVPESLNFSVSTVKAEHVNRACLRPVIKEIYAKNTGDFPLVVGQIKVSGTDCGSGGFSVQNCSHFVLKPGQSHMLLVAYLSDFSGPVAHGDLELALGSGMVVIPMKASVPIYTLDLCRKSLFWTRVKKLFGGFLIVAPFLCLVLFSAFPQSMLSRSEVLHYKGKRGSVGIIPSVGKSSITKGNTKSGQFISPSPKMDLFPAVDEEEPLLLGSVRCADDHESILSKPVVSSQQSSPVDNIKEMALLNSVSSGAQPPQLSNLTVKVEKEKGRRRRKRKGAGTALSGLFEVSSSHSGNSTPSSPLSPISSRRIWPLSPDGDSYPLLKSASGQETIPVVGLTDPEVPIYNDSSRFTPQKQQPPPPPAPAKMASKPVVLPSAGFPSAGKPYLRTPPVSPHSLSSTATIPPHARAPGPRLCNEKKGATPQEEDPGPRDLYKYDIWGDHLSGLKLNLWGNGTADESGVVRRTTNTDSESFFVRDPLALMTKYQQESVGFKKTVNG